MAEVDAFSVALTGAVSARLKTFRANLAKADPARRTPKISTAVELLLSKALDQTITTGEIRKYVDHYNNSGSGSKKRINIVLDRDMYSKLFDKVVDMLPVISVRQTVIFVGLCVGLSAVGLSPPDGHVIKEISR